MIPIEKHEQEIFWLKRRVKYLEELNSLVNQLPDDDSISSLNSKFSKVSTPRELIDRLEEVYEGGLE